MVTTKKKGLKNVDSWISYDEWKKLAEQRGIFMEDDVKPFPGLDSDK